MLNKMFSNDLLFPCQCHTCDWLSQAEPYWLSNFSLLYVVYLIVSGCKGLHNHVDKQPAGEVDDWGEEEDGEADPNLTKCDGLHICQEKTENITIIN